MKKTQIYLGYLAAIIAAELITVFVSPVGGIIFYFIILSLIILHSSIVGQDSSNKLALAFGLAPFIRILSLSITFAELSQVSWYLVVSAPLLVGILSVAMSLNLHPPEIGFARDASSFQIVITLQNKAPYKIPIGKISLDIGYQQILIAITGVVIGFLGYYILEPEPLIDHLTVQEFIAPALVLLVCTGFIEELAFRGVMQNSAMKILGSWGWVYIAVISAIFQLWHESVPFLLFSLVVALFFGWSVKKTGSITGVSLSHGLGNIFLYLIFPFVIKISE